MTTPNLLSAVLIATSMLSGPAMAREHHLALRHTVRGSYASSVVPNAASADGRSCTRAPRVGAFATEPWTDPPCEPAINY
jgi:hypothetical protein